MVQFTDAYCDCRVGQGRRLNAQGPDSLSSAWLSPFNSRLSAGLLVVCLLPSFPPLLVPFDSTFAQYPGRLISPLCLLLTSLNAPSTLSFWVRSELCCSWARFILHGFTFVLALLIFFPGLSFMLCCCVMCVSTHFFFQTLKMNEAQSNCSDELKVLC